jgi:CheY-like chemotaxis protein
MALIVVADDEYLIVAILAEILEDEGHEVVMASHGQDALERIRARRPALVITDFMMPLMTGLELAQAIKADQEIADLPIILMSGAQGAIGRQHGELFAAVLDKPYKNEALLAIVNRILADASDPDETK